jgi:hypothetical protein
MIDMVDSNGDGVVDLLEFTAAFAGVTAGGAPAHPEGPGEPTGPPRPLGPADSLGFLPATQLIRMQSVGSNLPTASLADRELSPQVPAFRELVSGAGAGAEGKFHRVGPNWTNCKTLIGILSQVSGPTCEL